jgi:hypothetical protein
MKYTIEGFSQNVMMELGFDCVDAVILRWIVDFFNTGKMKHLVYEGKAYVWINYQYVLDSLPLLGITNRRVLARRLDRICESGLMESTIEKSAQGTYTYFRFVEDVLESMLQPHGTFESTPTVPKSTPPTRLESTPVDSSIRDNSSNTDTNTLCGFDDFWNVWPKHERKSNKQRCMALWRSKKLYECHTEVIAAVERWKLSKQWTKDGGEFIPGPDKWLFQEKWLSADAIKTTTVQPDYDNPFGTT